MRKWFFNILIYLSIGFLAVYLYQYNYLDLSAVKFNYWLLAISVLFLWLGFVGSALAWGKCLALHSMSVSRLGAIASHGLSVFAKFIPGKVWVVLGRASNVSLDGQSLKTASYASVKEQLVYVWIGLALGIVLLLAKGGSAELLFLVALLFLGLTVFNLSDWFRKLVALLYKKITKREFNIPRISLKDVAALSGSIAIYWMLWSVGFWLFAKSIVTDIPLAAALVFPLSVTLGLLAVIVPGGLGVREGFLVLGLKLFGVPIHIATTISVASRLWFLSGETFIFLLGLLARYLCKQKGEP